jgi:hypothetical protein
VTGIDPLIPSIRHDEAGVLGHALAIRAGAKHTKYGMMAANQGVGPRSCLPMRPVVKPGSSSVKIHVRPSHGTFVHRCSVRTSKPNVTFIQETSQIAMLQMVNLPQGHAWKFLARTELPEAALRPNCSRRAGRQMRVPHQTRDTFSRGLRGLKYRFA